MGMPDLSRKAAIIFNEYKLFGDKSIKWANEIQLAEAESDLSLELQEFLKNPYYMMPKPIEVEKHLPNQHDQSSHGKGGSAPSLSDEEQKRLEGWRRRFGKAAKGDDATEVLERDQPQDIESEAKEEFLNEWVQGDYRAIQRNLVSDSSDEYYDELLDKADYAYERNEPLSEDIILHRAAGQLPFDPETAQPWDAIRVPVYTATTTNPDLRYIRLTGLGGQNTIRILAKKGSRSVLWNGEGGENEAVINHGAGFRILNIEKDGENWQVDLLLRG